MTLLRVSTNGAGNCVSIDKVLRSYSWCDSVVQRVSYTRMCHKEVLVATHISTVF